MTRIATIACLLLATLDGDAAAQDRLRLASPGGFSVGAPGGYNVGPRLPRLQEIVAAARSDSVMTPNRDEHRFGYDATGLYSSYDPPGAVNTTFFEYSDDGRIDLITLPNAMQVDIAFGGAGDERCWSEVPDGQLCSIAYFDGAGGASRVSVSYDADSGAPASLSKTGGADLEFSYRDGRVERERWTFEDGVSGALAVERDELGRPIETAVDGFGPSIWHAYDASGGLERVGEGDSRDCAEHTRMLVTLDPTHGRIESTFLCDRECESAGDRRGVTTEYCYNGFGELATMRTSLVGAAERPAGVLAVRPQRQPDARCRVRRGSDDRLHRDSNVGRHVTSRIRHGPRSRSHHPHR